LTIAQALPCFKSLIVNRKSSIPTELLQPGKYFFPSRGNTLSGKPDPQRIDQESCLDAFFSACVAANLGKILAYHKKKDEGRRQKARSQKQGARSKEQEELPDFWRTCIQIRD
jgi:hypothetical protein